MHVFETFKCLGQNSSNSSCQLRNHISIFLKILHNSFVSRDTTSLYFFSLNLIYFPQKELSKYKFGEISGERSKVWHFTIWWAPFVQNSYLAWHWRVMQSLKEKLTCGLKYDMRTLVNFHPTTQKSENFTLMGSFCPKVWAKKIQRSYLSRHWPVMQNLDKPWPCDLGQKWHEKSSELLLEYSKVWKIVLW